MSPPEPDDMTADPPTGSGWADRPLGAAARASGGGSERAESILARALRERLVRGLNDPRIRGMISVIGVDLSPDRAAATVRISVLPLERAALTLAGLASATPHLRSHLRKATRLRIVPRLEFTLDAGIRREAEIAEALRLARGDDPEPTPPDSPNSPSNHQSNHQSNHEDAT